MVRLCNEGSFAHPERSTEGGGCTTPCPGPPRPITGTIRAPKVHLQKPEDHRGTRERGNPNQGMREELLQAPPGAVPRGLQPPCPEFKPITQCDWEQLSTPPSDLQGVPVLTSRTHYGKSSLFIHAL